MSTVAQKLYTAEEFARLPEPEDGSKQELVRGVIITRPPPRFRHGSVQGRTYFLLETFTRPRRMGRAIVETGLITERDPDSVRGPDVAYWSAERLPLDQEPAIYPDVAADLAIEVLSPGEKWRRILQKLKEYFVCGVRMVWVVDAAARTVTVYRSPKKKRTLGEKDLLSGEDVIPGFSCRVSELFE